MHPDHLCKLHPNIYHMAEVGTWDSIRTLGLMSTSAVLEHFNLPLEDRARIESSHRPNKIKIGPSSSDCIVLRDQIPMPPERLRRALANQTTIEEWYSTINSKVFFWAQEERLYRLLNARHYRNLEHDVLTIDAGKFISAYKDSIWLCHMNSGNTFPMAVARDKSIFKRIIDYPVNGKGNPIKKIVELTVDYKIPDIAKYVTHVRRMKGNVLINKIL